LVQPCGWCIIWLHEAPAAEDRIPWLFRAIPRATHTDSPSGVYRATAGEGRLG
jgi:hypothetical protein